MVKIKVHRGLNQIGGCITEIWTDTSRVFIDMGQNLPGNAEPTTPEDDEKMVKELFAQNKKEYEAVFYTHGHEDHIGLFMYVPDDVPQYMSAGTKEIIFTKYELVAESHKKSWKKADIELTKEYYEEIVKEDKQRIEKLKGFKTWERPVKRQKPEAISIGDIKITPFYSNHSIFDASMFLIEADGKRIWHTWRLPKQWLQRKLVRYAQDIRYQYRHAYHRGHDAQPRQGEHHRERSLRQDV